jgi:hypothetical protein
VRTRVRHSVVCAAGGCVEVVHTEWPAASGRPSIHRSRHEEVAVDRAIAVPHGVNPGRADQGTVGHTGTPVAAQAFIENQLDTAAKVVKVVKMVKANGIEAD